MLGIGLEFLTQGMGSSIFEALIDHPFHTLEEYRKVKDDEANKIKSQDIIIKVREKKQLIKDKEIELTEDEKYILQKDVETLKKIRDIDTDINLPFVEPLLELMDQQDEKLRNKISTYLKKVEFLGLGEEASKLFKIIKKNDPDGIFLKEIEEKLDKEIEEYKNI